MSYSSMWMPPSPSASSANHVFGCSVSMSGSKPVDRAVSVIAAFRDPRIDGVHNPGSCRGSDVATAANAPRAKIEGYNASEYQSFAK